MFLAIFAFRVISGSAQATGGYRPAVDHVLSNRVWWDGEAPNWVESGRRSWADEHPPWGVYGVPESDVGLPGAFGGADPVDRGRGTACASPWPARQGGRPVRLAPLPAPAPPAPL